MAYDLDLSKLFNISSQLGILGDIAAQVGRPGEGQFNYNAPVYTPAASAARASANASPRGGAVASAASSSRGGRGGSRGSKGGGSSKGPKKGSQAWADAQNRQNIPKNPPPGTVKIIGTGNGAGVAYDAQGNALGIVQAALSSGAAVVYDASQNPAAVAIQGTNDPYPTTDFYGNPTPADPQPYPGREDPRGPNGGKKKDDPRPKFAFDANDPQYTSDLAARERAFQTMLANTTAGEDTLGSSYGFGFQRYGADQYNPQGALIARTGDVNQRTLSTPQDYNAQTGLSASNPFSRASLLNQSYVRANRMGTGSYANRGMLTSGAYGQSLLRTGEARNKSFDALQKDFASRLNEYRNQRETGYTQRDVDKTNLFRDAFARQRDTFLANNPS